MQPPKLFVLELIFSSNLLRFFCDAYVKSKQIWRKPTNQEAALQNHNKLSIPTTKNQNKCVLLDGKNLLILTEKNCRGCMKI